MPNHIANTLREVVIRQAGNDGWDALLRRADLEDREVVHGPLDDDGVRRLVQATCDTLHLHWLATYGPPVAGPTSPRLSYEWTGERTMVMTYESHRSLVDLLVALLVGIGQRVPDALRVTRTGSRSVELVLAA